MNTDRCLAVLELESCISVEQARHAYRDLVRVWHPDRFAGDPRLRGRAEEKVKQLNAAYEELVRHLERSGGIVRRSREESSVPTGGKEGSTEAFFEAGTRNVLTMWHSLGRAARRIVQESRGEDSKENARGKKRTP